MKLVMVSGSSLKSGVKEEEIIILTFIWLYMKDLREKEKGVEFSG